MTKIKLFLKSGFFLSFIVGLLIFSIFIFKYFSYITFYQPINISVYGLNEKELNKIIFYCNTPLDRKFILNRVDNNWCTNNFAFYKNIKIFIDESVKRKISLVDIKIGNIKYKFNNNDFNKFWLKCNLENLYVSPPVVKDDGTYSRMLFSIRYWNYPFKKIFIFLAFCILLFIVLRKKYRVLLKSIVINFFKLFKLINYKRILKNILIALTYIIFILFIIEMILRIYGYFYETKDKNINKKKYNFTILCIGDSFTYGVGATEHKDYPSQLEKMLNNKSGKKFIMINRGIPGQNSTEALLNLKNQIKIYKPDLVILNIGDANFRNFSGYGSSFNKFLYKFRIYKLLSYYYFNYIQKNIDAELDKFLWENAINNDKKGKNELMFKTENIKSKIYKTAYKQVQKSINKEIKTESDYYNIGTFYLRKNNFSEALKWYNEGISKFPDCYNINEGLTYLYYFQMKYDDAKKYLKKCTINKNLDDIKALQKDSYLTMELWRKRDTSDIEIKKLLYFLNINWDYYYYSNTYYLTLEKLTDKHYILIREWLATDLQKMVDFCNYYHSYLIIHNYPFLKSHFFMILANKILKAIANDNSIPFVDNLEIFNKSENNILKLFDLKNGGYHPNSQGYAHIAKNLYDKIVELKLFDNNKIQYYQLSK